MKNTNNTGVLSYICLGSNSGNSLETFSRAEQMLANHPGTKPLASSAVYRTEPQDDKNQPWFLNQVLELLTDLAPLELLKLLQDIENKLGRKRDPARRFGPRALDLDILYYGGITMETPELSIPHPRMWERAFVLVPLREIAFGALRKSAELALENLEYLLDNDKIYQNR